MKKIKLANGGFTMVDNCDYKELSQHKWYSKAIPKLYVLRRKHKDGVRKTILMHRQILGLTKTCVYCDHIDGNGLNNVRNNLRPCTSAQNQMNRKKGLGCSSKYKGVFHIKKHNKWLSHITVNKKLIRLGTFNSEIDAAKCYDKNAIKFFKEFAYLNFK